MLSEKPGFLMVGGLLLLLLLAAQTGRALAFPAPSITFAVVRSYHYDDGSTGTQFLAKVNGPSPEDIASFQVTGPSGPFSLNPATFTKQMGLLYFYGENTILNNGTYTFTVTDDVGRTASVNRDFTYDPSLPQVTSGMTPFNGAYLGTTTPTLSFDAVPGDYSYQIFIDDTKAVWYHSDRTKETSFAIPSGALQPNMPYAWYVRVFDNASQNFYESGHTTFFTGTSPYTIDLTDCQVSHVEAQSGSSLINMSVINPGLAPWNITYSGVTTPDNTFLRLDGQEARFYGEFWHTTGTSIFLNGDYTFLIQDAASSAVTEVRSLNIDPVPAVSEASMVPADNAYFPVNTPTFRWDPVSGASPPYYYMLRIKDYDGGTKWYSSPILTVTETSFTVPDSAGLPWSSSYKWEILVLDDTTKATINNVYRSSSRTFTIFRANPPEAKRFYSGQAHNLED